MAAHQAPPGPWDSPGKNTGVGCHFLLQCMKVKSEVAQSCPTLSDPMDCSLPGSSSMGSSRQEYWSGLPRPPPGDLPNGRIESVSPASPALQADSLLLSHQRSLNSGVHVSLPVMASSGYMPSSRIAGSCGSFIPSFFFKESPYCSPQWLYQFTFPATV